MQEMEFTPGSHQKCVKNGLELNDCALTGKVKGKGKVR